MKKIDNEKFQKDNEKHLEDNDNIKENEKKRKKQEREKNKELSKEHRKKKRKLARIRAYKEQRTNIEMVLIGLVIISMIRQFFLGNFDNVFLGGLTMVLFLIPRFLERELNVDIPIVLQTIILIFIFCAEILGEINAFYIKIPIWDTLLHTTNGFLMAAIGFALIDIFNRSERFSLKMSPYFVGFVAFCFSMTIGVLWEFFEFGMDQLAGTDMQKDWIIHSFNTVMLDQTHSNIPINVSGINEVIINGKELGLGGYLDIGLIDTMKDLIVNFIGAVVFSVIGIIFLKNKGKGGFASQFIPQVNQPIDLDEEMADKNKTDAN